ncbi:MAG TPA: squalene--hopene cyclase, partial [Myxococcales bacterium]|nr:squalene--hopene cyclase [Myxococcales bacterium]
MLGRETRLEAAGLGLVIERSQDWFFRDQHADGFWWGELESNATMDAEYLLLTHFLGARDEQIWRGVAQDIRNYQRGDGSWALYHGAPGDLSTSIECYFALKLAGDAGPHLERAREFILSKGGISHARVFTRIWLSLFGEFSWDDLPSMPPELMLLPPKAPFSIYQFSSWARGTIVPLLILLKTRPVRAVPESARLTGLHTGAAPQPKPRVATDHLFYGIDAALHLYDKRPVKALREHAVKVAEEWILDRQEADGSWGGIQPPWVYSLMALHSLGYGLDHPVIRKGLDGMHDRWLIRREDGSMRVQACLSPVWDTGLSLLALLDSGVPPEDPHVRSAASWLLKEEIRGPGDWQVQLPGVPPSGWAFEFENDTYPDVDDTAVVMLALQKAGALDPEIRERSLRWVLAMQSKNGGWAAFDKDNTSKLPAMLPFADFGEMIDPPSA